MQASVCSMRSFPILLTLKKKSKQIILATKTQSSDTSCSLMQAVLTNCFYETSYLVIRYAYADLMQLKTNMPKAN